MNLDFNRWKAFPVNKILTIFNGKGITKEEIEENKGSFAVVQSGETNNAVLGRIDLNYCKLMNYTYTEKPCLTVARSGSAGFVSFQIDGCVVGDSAKILLLDDDIATIEHYLFLQSVLMANKFKYTYGRKVTEEKYMNDLIDLPVLYEDGKPFVDIEKRYSEEGYTPDWRFMEKYIKSLHYKPLITKNNKGNSIKLNVQDWKWFQIKEISNVYTGGDLILSMVDDGEIPVASHKVENNGIGALVDEIRDRRLFDSEKTIALADRGCFHASVQTNNFYIGTRVKALEMKKCVSKGVLIFITTIINQETFKYSYGRNCTSGIENVKIKLPIKRNFDGTPFIDRKKKYSKYGYVPDWKYMDDYIKSLPYGDRL